MILAGVGPCLIYGVMAGPNSPTANYPMFIGGLVAVQVGAIAWLTTGSLLARYRAIAAVAAAAAVLAAMLGSGLPARSFGMAMGGLCHAAAYTGLLVWFAASLRPGREPVVTQFARQMRQTMPAAVVRYTRRVTIAWCIFFAAQIGTSAVLLATAPPPVFSSGVFSSGVLSSAAWSSFVNLWSLPLVAAMFLMEYGCRVVLFRHESRTGLIATVAGLVHARGSAGRPP
jgi:uncharacterized membrane protein